MEPFPEPQSWQELGVFEETIRGPSCGVSTVKLVGEISSFWSWWCCFEGWRFFGIERGHKWVICYSDSAQLVQLVNHEMRPLHDYRDEVKKVKDHMGRDWLCQVQHSFCEGNACVDDLTRMGVTIGGGWALLTEPPLEIMTHLLADSHWGMINR